MKKVTLTIVKNFYKTAQIEIEVDENLCDENLQEFLTNDSEVALKMEEKLSLSTLNDVHEEWRYQDPTNNDGGHL